MQSSFVFNHKNWHTLGTEPTRALLHILNHNGDIFLINETILVLIPKKQNSKTVRDFRQISLCNTLYKCLSKVLADKLKSVFHSIISLNQSAFLKGRQITDNILIANELIHAIHTRRTGKIAWAAIKLDMEKAFDRVKWKFLNHLLSNVGFPSHFIGLIMKCLSTVTYRLSLNGSLSEVFHSSRGIRQGDPLSPYLFLLVAEGFSAVIRLHENMGTFNGIRICRGAPSLSHLLFADDSILFTLATSSSSEAINNALNLYHQAICQLVNRDKSSILFSPNTPHTSQNEFWMALHLAGESLLWGRQLLKQGLVWRIGSGHTIPLSTSNWIPGISSPTILHPIDPSLSFVSFFITPDHTWNVSRLKHYFPLYQVNKILQTPLHNSPADTLISGFHHSGILTVKSAYHLASATANKVLLQPSCNFCGNTVESVSHALVDCARARHIWKHTKFKDFHTHHRNYNIKDYYLQALQLISKEDLPLFASIIWHIWTTRNSILFRNSSEPNNVKEFVCNYLQEYREAQELHSQDSFHSASHQHPHVSRQEIIQEDTPALYVDAALDQDRCVTGIGCVFKVGSSRIIASTNILKPGAPLPIFAKAQALFHGLSWCFSSQLMPRFIFTDCLNLVSKVNGKWLDNSALSILVAQIRHSFSNFPGVSLLHLPRQLNTTAHFLAREAIRLRGDAIEDSV
uniref:Reverse transcriptase domain-containing protein n=1 Tax=Cannabis sativa TaxID=3483 RepID=A0A803PKP6_CANSA